MRWERVGLAAAGRRGQSEKKHKNKKKNTRKNGKKKGQQTGSEKTRTTNGLARCRYKTRKTSTKTAATRGDEGRQQGNENNGLEQPGGGGGTTNRRKTTKQLTRSREQKKKQDKKKKKNKTRRVTVGGRQGKGAWGRRAKPTGDRLAEPAGREGIVGGTWGLKERGYPSGAGRRLIGSGRLRSISRGFLIDLHRFPWISMDFT